MYDVAAFYRFTPIDDIPALRKEIQEFGASVEGLCGTILLAPEGINGTIGALSHALPQIINFLDEKYGVKSGELKYSKSERTPFNRFKVRPKKEIITMKRPEANPTKQVGKYVTAQDWNTLADDPDVTVIDTRNIYETGIGTFEKAIDPRLNTFSEFPEWVEKNLDPKKNKKIAMFCTGGIRCEKASSYMLAQGFEEVYHLKGGILKYLETIPADQSQWQGECFVFDNRVAIKHGLEEGGHTICHGCRAPLSAEETKHPKYEKGVSCPHCVENLTPQRIQNLRYRHQQFMKSRT